MSEQSLYIISKVWDMCGPLRDDDVSYGDYTKQLPHLISLIIHGQYQVVLTSGRNHAVKKPERCI